MKLNSFAITLSLVAFKNFSLVNAAVKREIQNFLDQDEIDLILQNGNANSAIQPHHPDYHEHLYHDGIWTHGRIPTSLFDKIANDTPYYHRGLRFSPSWSNKDPQEAPFQIKTMHSTTDVHTDINNGRAPVGKQQASTIIFLNTNENAIFVHGDEAIPVEAGTLINFQADEPHHTVIEDGYVQVMVPFARRRVICSPSEEDDDNDGVFNDEDECDGTVEGDDVNSVGCSAFQIIERECPCEGGYRNHGQFMRCVNNAIEEEDVLFEFNSIVIDFVKSQLAETDCGM